MKNLPGSAVIRVVPVPDPLDTSAPHGGMTEVHIVERAWRHIIEKHVANPGEPWSDLFTKDERKTLKRWAAGKSLGPEEQPAWNTALDKFAQQIKRCLSRPLVVLYTKRLAGLGPRRHWLLVLPVGAVGFVRQSTGGQGPINKVVTCYFPRNVAVLPIRKRWRAVVSRLVLMYGRLDRNRVYPPESTPSQPEAKPLAEGVSEVCFVTLGQWGFSLVTPGNPWCGRPPEWPDEPPPTSAKAKNRLRRRSRVG